MILSTPKKHYLIWSTLLMPFQAALAVENCDYATDLLFYAYQAGDASKKKLLFYKSLQICPNQPEVHNTLATILKQQGKYDKAIYHYKQAFKLRPNFYQAWFGLGETYYKQERFPLSLEAYSYICKINPDAKARIMTILRNKPLAITDLDKIIDEESFLVLYDYERRQALNKRLFNCGLPRVKGQPVHTFFNLYFDTKKATLRAGIEHQLDEIAAALRNIQFLEIVIHGHTDVRGFSDISVAASKQRNLQLSQERAAAIATALAQRGISKTRLKIYGHGSEHPLVLGRSPEAFAKNRRIEIEVKPVVTKPYDDDI
ncbi:MAG: OmpA family protein [Pseudomonadota bacterium]